jgi:hypothetical protein
MLVGNGNWLDSPDLFLLNRNQRRDNLKDIIVLAMQDLNTNPMTKDQLCKLVRIRRKTFRHLLNRIVQSGVIEKIGGGVKTDPFKYRLALQYQRS